VIFLLGLVRTALAVELIAEHALKGVLDDIMAIVGLEEGFYFFHKLIEKFIGIALHHRIYGHAFIGDKALTEFLDVCAAVAAVLQSCEDFLELKDFVVGGVLAVGGAIDGEEVLAEVGDHEELLDEAVYVACRAHVLQTTEYVSLLPFRLKHPAVVAVSAPTSALQLGSNLLYDEFNETLLGKQDFLEGFVEKFEGGVVADAASLFVEEEVFEEEGEESLEVVGAFGSVEGVDEKFEGSEEEVIVLLFGGVGLSAFEDSHDEVLDGVPVLLLLEQGMLFTHEGVHKVDHKDVQKFRMFLLCQKFHFEEAHKMAVDCQLFFFLCIVVDEVVFEILFYELKSCFAFGTE
jgi:hypothetical protein